MSSALETRQKQPAGHRPPPSHPTRGPGPSLCPPRTLTRAALGSVTSCLKALNLVLTLWSFCHELRAGYRRPLLKTQLEFQESECMSLILVGRHFLFSHVPDISDPHCLLHRQSVRPTGPVSLGKTWRNSRPSFLMPSCPVIASGEAGALSPGHALDPRVYADSALGFVTNL